MKTIGCLLSLALFATVTSAQTDAPTPAPAVSAAHFFVGLVLEGEYLATPKLGISLRVVNEKVTVNGSSVNGDHVGLGLNYYS
jgi:hypothetical protein